MKIETLAVHAGHTIDPATGAVAAPIHLSTTFERDVEGTYPRGFMYTRNNNPNREALERGVIRIVIARVHEPARISAFDIAFEGGGKMDRRGDRTGGRVDRVTRVDGEG